VIPVCGRIDLAFLIESSANIGKHKWRRMLNLIMLLSRKLLVTPDRVRIAVVSFSNKATLHFGLDSHKTLASMGRTIDKIRWKGYWTNTAAALRMMKNKVFKVCNILECDRECYN